MRIGTLTVLSGVIILAVFAAPLVYFLYYIGTHGTETIVVNVSSTPGPPCHANEYAMTLYYGEPVPLTNVRLEVTLAESNGSTYSTVASAGSLTKGGELYVCLPQGVLEEATSITVNLTGYVGGLYRLSITSQQSLR